MMITDAEIEKLLAVRCAQPTILSLYLGLPSDPPSLRSLPAHAGELISEAAQADWNDAGQACGAQEQDEDRRIARRLLEIHAREWLGRTVAIFASGEPRLAEAMTLPCLVPDQAVLATRPHVRPLLLALQRCPGYYLAIAGSPGAWAFRVTGDRIDRMTLPSGVHNPGFGGWCALEAHRAQERVTGLACHPCGDVAGVLGRLMSGGGQEPLVVSGCPDDISRFLAALPGDAGDRCIGSLAADPFTARIAQVAEQAGHLTTGWAAEREERLVLQAARAPEELRTTGLQACLTAVNAGAADLLIVPESGLVPGLACGRCGTLSQTGTDCPDWGAASAAVPDLIEEMVVRALHDGAQVVVVREPPGGIMARLRYPLTGDDERDGCAGHLTADAVGSVRA